jgi:hypothetical protein
MIIMLGEIDFCDKYGKASAKLTVYGNNETIYVELRRVNVIGHRLMTINKHCGFWETIRDLTIYPNVSYRGTSESDVQQYFEDRINAAIKSLSHIGELYVIDDERNSVLLHEKQKTDKEKLEDLSKFISRSIEMVKKDNV